MDAYLEKMTEYSKAWLETDDVLFSVGNSDPNISIPLKKLLVAYKFNDKITSDHPLFSKVLKLPNLLQHPLLSDDFL